MNFDQQSLKLHKKHRGKLAIVSAVPLRNRKDLSLAYTPGVAAASLAIAKDPIKVFDYTAKGRMVAVVTDGSAVLGLGNIGPLAALPVMEGKAILFKEFGGVDAFPIALATQDVDKIVETVKMIAPMFGGINLEDISAPRCFEIEERLSHDLDIPVFHDDQHGTAIVVLAGLINAMKVVGKKLADAKIVINGAGAAGIAVAKLLLLYSHTMEYESGKKAGDIILLDTKGAIYKGRDDLNKYKAELGERTNREKQSGELKDVIRGADVFIGVSKPDILKPAMVRTMAKKPIIFAMANPVPEIMPDEARRAGAVVVATGRSDFPNQINNLLAFPGVFQGLFRARISRLTNEMKIRAAEALARYVKNPTPTNIIPSALDKNVARVVARAIIKG
jgi:malate dehydrogenase (oxaloacetate-decarboxylating)